MGAAIFFYSAELVFLKDKNDRYFWTAPKASYIHGITPQTEKEVRMLVVDLGRRKSQRTEVHWTNPKCNCRL